MVVEIELKMDFLIVQNYIKKFYLLTITSILLLDAIKLILVGIIYSQMILKILTN